MWFLKVMSLIGETSVLTDNFSFSAQSVDYIRASLFINITGETHLYVSSSSLLDPFLYLHLFLVCFILFLTSMMIPLDCECLWDLSQLVENTAG